MRIDTLLVNPQLANVSTTSFYVMPVGLLSIAAYLRMYNIKTKVIDLNTIKENLTPYTQEEFFEESPTFVGVSVMVAGQLQAAREVLQNAKKFLPDVLTAVGGAHVSQFPVDILKNCPEIDFVVLGEGEVQAHVCADYAKFKIEPLFWPNGIAYRDNADEVIVNEKESYIKDIESLPYPAYDLVNYEDYLHDTKTWHNPYHVDFGVRVPLITSRGCPNLCNFCSVATCMGLYYRPISAEKVVELIEFMQNKHNAKYFAIYDANFAQDTKRVIDICNLIKKKNIKIFLDLPTGLPINATAIEMIDALADVGLIRTCISVESGDATIRNDVMKKNIEQTEIYAVVNKIRTYQQIFLLTDFVLGMPEDTMQSVEASCKIIEELDIDDIALTVAAPYPGTELYNQCTKEKLFCDGVVVKDLWKAEWLSHDNVSRFTIKPYALEIQQLREYRDRILSFRIKKKTNYLNRMEKIFGITSEYSGR
jgi:radical SAM superfamily enzyme YgiQ (UPF0313 family)